MENTKIKRIIIAICVVVLMGLSFGVGYYVNYLSLPKNLRLLKEVCDLIDEYYVGVTYNEQTGEYEYIEFTNEDYAKAMVDALLDNYSTFYTADEYADYVQTANGNYVGIGTSFLTKSKNDLVVFKVALNSPAFHAGLKEGDKLIKIEYNNAEYLLDSYDAYINVLGQIPLKTNFKLYIENKVEPFELQKMEYKQSYVEYKDSTSNYNFISVNSQYLEGVETTATNAFDNDTAYIALTEFSGNAGNEMANALNYMQTRGRTKLILDLRKNGGGAMNILCQIASYFVKNDNGSGQTLITNAVNSKGEAVAYYTTKYAYTPMNIVVLADENTASASECLIGAMLSSGTITENGLVLVKNSEGEARTYGKGIMQTFYLSKDSSFTLKLTSAVLYWANGNCIHGRGITTTEQNSIPIISGTDAQLERAKTILN